MHVFFLLTQRWISSADEYRLQDTEMVLISAFGDNTEVITCLSVDTCWAVFQVPSYG